jgi:hypothetical protein
MNSDHAVRCETRADLNWYGVGIFLLSVVVLFFVFAAVRISRLPPDLGVLGAGYVALLAWVAFRVREWLVLGDATLLFSPAQPRVGQRFTCRVPPAVQGTARAELICQSRSHSGTGKNRRSRTTKLWRDSQTALTPGLIEFTFDPPRNLPHAHESPPRAGEIVGDEVRWWLKVRGQGNSRFRRRFRVPLGPSSRLELQRQRRHPVPAWVAHSRSSTVCARSRFLRLPA